MKRYAVDAGEKAAYHAELEEQVRGKKIKKQVRATFETELLGQCLSG